MDIFDAVRNNDIEDFKKALEMGVDVNEKDKWSYTALMYMAFKGHTEIVQLLIDKGANINEKDNYSDTALMYAIINRRIDSVKLLLDNGAKNIPNNEGETPFKKAIKKNNKEILKLFLTHLTHDELVRD